MMTELQISKYDPKYRDSQGRYLRDEWTSVYDVGKTFQEKILTEDEYRTVETEYVAAVSEFLKLTQTDSLRVTDFEDHAYDLEDLPNSMVEEARDWLRGIKDGVLLSGKKIEECIRLNLREVIWCRLFSPDGNTYVHFGDDYYMFVGSLIMSIPSEAIDTPLFVEEYPSPCWEVAEGEVPGPGAEDEK